MGREPEFAEVALVAGSAGLALLDGRPADYLWPLVDRFRATGSPSSSTDSSEAAARLRRQDSGPTTYFEREHNTRRTPYDVRQMGTLTDAVRTQAGPSHRDARPVSQAEPPAHDSVGNRPYVRKPQAIVPSQDVLALR